MSIICLSTTMRDKSKLINIYWMTISVIYCKVKIIFYMSIKIKQKLYIQIFLC